MDMTGQPRLFKLAIEAGQMQIHHDGHHGWSLYVHTRRCGDTWQSETPQFYGGLGTAELLDTICAVWADELGL